MKDALARKWISGIVVGSGFMPTIGGTMTGQLLSAVGTAGAPGIAGAGDADTGMNWPGADTIAFSTGGVERMRLDASGNLGIGTGAYALDAKLDVNGGVLGGTAGDEVNVQRSTIPSSSGGSVARLLTTLHRISNGTTWATTEMRLRGMIDATEMSYISMTLPGVGGMAFGTGFGSPAERMRIDASGRLLIGTTTGTDKLTVAGTGNFFGVQIGTGGSNVSSNTAVGLAALASNTTGSSNTAFGYVGLTANTTGSNNTAFGFVGLFANTTGSNNTAFGYGALYNATTGDGNSAFGAGTGSGITTGRANTILGANVTGLAAGLSNNIIIADGDGNRRINVDASGYVGIGTGSPSYKLHVLGNFGIAPGVGTTVTPANNADLVIETTSNTTLTFKLKGSDGVVRTGTVALA